MNSEIKYIELDGRGEEEKFHTCVLDALKELKLGEGIHIIKEFEPFPLYGLMEKHGLDKKVEQKGENEYHAWFFPKTETVEPEMKQHLNLDNERIKKMLDIKIKVFRNELTPKQAKELVNKTFESVTAEEFAYGEQHILEYGITDDIMVEGMDDIIEIFNDVLIDNDLNLPDGHPILTYANEAGAIEKVLVKMEGKLAGKFIKNEWLELYDKLSQINIHFSRKQNQLFSALERKGFDRPSKVMWTFDNNVREIIKESYSFLETNSDKAFIKAQANVIHLVRDILEKEKKILYPTSIKLLSNEEFALMRKSDDEIGYCLIDTPAPFTAKKPYVSTPKSQKEENQTDLLSDLAAVLQKHNVVPTGQGSDILDVSMGKLTLEQINLIFKHLQVDLSYVDENEIVKFYSDTKHRVFPRSAGVIGREVQNCHPRESVETVEAIIEAFRKGEQEKAEFWLDMGGKFIYIIYNAVHDEQGNFRGILEMMQDVTHIRSLSGSQKLLTWDNNDSKPVDNNTTKKETKKQDINADTIIAPLLKKYPFLKEYLISLNPKFNLLNNTIVFNTMGNIASLEMIAKKGDFEVNDLVEKLQKEVERNSKI